MERHASIVNALSSGFVTDFETAKEEYQPKCAKHGLPSPWMDYDRYPQNREDYETRMPTAAEADALCRDENDELCPLAEMCLDYALSTNQTHGVWGGKRLGSSHRGLGTSTILPDGVDSPDVSNSERGT